MAGRFAGLTEFGRFPPVPYPVVAERAGLRRAPDVVSQHENASRALQREVSHRLESSPRKEVVIFIHGYNNSFADAAVATSDICRTLRSEFVCIALTWPAGGSAGVFYGYNVDRESGRVCCRGHEESRAYHLDDPGHQAGAHHCP